MPRAKWWPGFHEGFVQLPKCKDVLMRLEQKIRKGVLRRQTNRRKKRRAGVREFLSLLVLLCTSGCGATFSFRPTVVFTGDSITSNWDANWAGQQATFAQNKWVDLAVVGITSAQIAAPFEADVLDLEPKAAHIVAGTNDVYPGWQLSITAKQYRGHGEKSESSSHRRGAWNHPPMGARSPAAKSRPKPAKVSAHRSAESMDHPIWGAARHPGGRLSLSARSRERREYIPALTVDGVHPSAAGYAVMTRTPNRLSRRQWLRTFRRVSKQIGAWAWSGDRREHIGICLGLAFRRKPYGLRRFPEPIRFVLVGCTGKRFAHPSRGHKLK